MSVSVQNEIIGLVLMVVAILSWIMGTYLMIAAVRQHRKRKPTQVPTPFLVSLASTLIVTVGVMYGLLGLLTIWDDEVTPLWGIAVVVVCAGPPIALFREWARLPKAQGGPTHDDPQS